MNVQVTPSYRDPSRHALEVVERKGIGHPDTLSDHLAEAVVPQNLIRRIHDNLRTHLRIRQIDADVAGMASRMATKAPRALGSGL